MSDTDTNAQTEVTDEVGPESQITEKPHSVEDSDVGVLNKSGEKEDAPDDDVADDAYPPDVYDDDHTDSGSEVSSDEEEEHSDEYSDDDYEVVPDEPINCDELYEEILEEIVEARGCMLQDLEEKKIKAEERREQRLEKKKQLIDTYLMYQQILKKIKKERDFLEDHIHQFLARRELTIKTEIKMTKDKKSRAERKLDFEWSKRLKEHRQKMDKKIARMKMRKAELAAEKERKRKLEIAALQEEEDEDESKGTDVEGAPPSQIEVVAKPDAQLNVSVAVLPKTKSRKVRKNSKKKRQKANRKAAKTKRKQNVPSPEENKLKEKSSEKPRKGKKHCGKKNPIDNPYSRQMRLLNHFNVQSEQSSIRNAKRLAELQEMRRIKKEEALEKRHLAKRNERERKIILRIMRFLYPEVMEKIRSLKNNVPVIKIDRKKRLKAIQARNLRLKKREEKDPQPENSKKSRIEKGIQKILKKALEKRSKLNLNTTYEEYEKVLKRILQLKLFWIECGKENEVKLKKILKKSELAEVKNVELLQHILSNIREISENAFYSSSLRKIPKSETTQFCNEITKMHKKMMESSLKCHKLSKAVKVAKRQLKKTQIKKRGRRDVQLLFEQFKADNVVLEAKLKAKNETKDRMELKILQTVETMAHLKEKMKFVQSRLSTAKTGYVDLTESVYERRDTLANIMLEYVDTKKAERGLNAEYGILESSRMLQDLDDTKLHCETLQDDERELRRELAKRLRELSNTKYRMEMMQIKAQEMEAEALQKQKDDELEAYKEKVREEMEKAANRKERMRALDTGWKGTLPSEKRLVVTEENDAEEDDEMESQFSYLEDEEEREIDDELPEEQDEEEYLVLLEE